MWKLQKCFILNHYRMEEGERHQNRNSLVVGRQLDGLVGELGVEVVQSEFP